jgi:cardiolipin synthase
MGSLFFAMVGLESLAEILLYLGLTLALLATGLYLGEGVRQLRQGRPGSRP